MKKRNDKAKIYTAVGIVLALFLAFAVSKRLNENNFEVVGYEDITVMCGQTLWGISERYAPDNMDKRQYIDAVKSLNGLGDNLYAGDTITLPIYEER